MLKFYHRSLYIVNKDCVFSLFKFRVFQKEKEGKVFG
jgi:hypothetical protein